MTAAGDLLGGRYRLERPIGSGGMATVWRAVDQDTGQAVAVKLMHPRVQDDPDLLARFRREADVVTRLDHPCIVRLLDQDAGADDGPYIVFELVEGTTLKALIRQRGHLPPAEAASIASQVARGLELAHRSGIVHRDIKSHNVLVTDGGVAMLTDFGIARLLDGMQDGLTRTGTVLGTSDYLAPEQARGLAVDGRTDVYALGIVLYESLTGELPFPADTPMAVALRQVRDPMPDPRAVRPEVPAYLAAIVLRACEKDPDARFASALDMADALVDVPEGGTETMPVIPPEVAAADADTGRLAAAVLPDDAATGVLAQVPPPGAQQVPVQAQRVVAQAPARRRWPVVIGGILVLGAGAAAAVVITSGGPDAPVPGAAVDGGERGSGGGFTGLVPLQLASVTDADPGGEGREMPGEVPLAYDGTEATAWRTERYATPDFGGLKDGVGLTLALEQPAVARRLDITTRGTGGAFQVIAGAPGPDARVVGRGTFRDGAQRVDLDDGPASATYTFWITELPPNVAGEGYRAYVSEVGLEGTP
ncbi:MAG: serine/threonine protein kinase [Thermoleophilia bacterium]|nr:serine/threonine protein kinase [Thermoleophilia bacterium]